MIISQQTRFSDLIKTQELLEQYPEIKQAFQTMRSGRGDMPVVTALGLLHDGVIFTLLYNRNKKLEAIQLLRVGGHQYDIGDFGCRWIAADVYVFQINQIKDI